MPLLSLPYYRVRQLGDILRSIRVFLRKTVVVIELVRESFSSSHVLLLFLSVFFQSETSANTFFCTACISVFLFFRCGGGKTELIMCLNFWNPICETSFSAVYASNCMSFSLTRLLCSFRQNLVLPNRKSVLLESVLTKNLVLWLLLNLQVCRTRSLEKEKMSASPKTTLA